MKNSRCIKPGQRNSIMIFVVSLLVSLLLLSACGAHDNSSTTSSGSVPTPGATSSPTVSVQNGYGKSLGCPSDSVLSSSPAPANVVATMKNSTVSAQPGDIVEVRLPFGQKWGSPQSAPTALQIQSPSGYAWKPDGSCVWRFLVKGSGNSELLFTGQPLCKAGSMCPMHIVLIPVTIKVK